MEDITMSNEQMIRNVFIMDGDVCTIYCDYNGKRYELRVNSDDMDRMNRDLNMVSVRKNPWGKMPKVYAVFKKECREQVCNPSNTEAVQLARYLMNIPPEEGYPAPTKVNDRCIDFTTGNITIQTLKERCSTNGRPKGGSKRGVYIRMTAKGTARYEASIDVKGKRKYLGTYKSRNEALAVRIQAEKTYWGQTLEEIRGGAR